MTVDEKALQAAIPVGSNFADPHLVRAIIAAYEAAKGGSDLLRMIETLPEDYTDDGNCCAGKLAAAPAASDIRKARECDPAQGKPPSHADCNVPGWEYATTEGPRKSWQYEDEPPEGEGWERNVDKGRKGWERFDYTEEAYWRRRKARE
jgi:hypothetical protein